MEESEKRRERLKVMRMEASRGGIDNIPQSLGIPSHGLSNPLIEGETVTPANYASPRFDYYTDPMAAFSANKRSSQVSHQAPQQYYNTPPSETVTPANYASPRFDYYTDPMAAFSANKRSSQVSHQAPQQYYNTPPSKWLILVSYFCCLIYPQSLGIPSHGLSNPLIEGETVTPANYASPRFDYYTDPMAAFSANKRSSQVSHQAPQQYYNTPPRPRHPDMTHSPAYQDQSLNSPGQRMFQAPRAYHNYGPVRSPSASPSGRISQSTWGAPSGVFNYSCSSNLPRGSNIMSPGFGQGGTPNFIYGRGRGLRYNSSPLYGSGRGAGPYPDTGRSRGRSSGYNSMSPGSGQRGRRGARLHSPVSAELRPDLYYNHEMIEDPWKEMNPVISKSKNFRTQILRNPGFQHPLA